MNFRFYIFGIPEGFDLYPNQGNTDEIKYFQLFYDGSSENTKLTIRHNVNGQVSYSYLKYKNVISGGGRSGAFFGMSIVFENEYCADVTNLLTLFETIYQDILQKGILLKKLSDTQIRFAVSKFIDAKSEISRVENIIKTNLVSNYKNDIKPIDFSTPSNQNVIFKINSENSNTDILSKLKEYAIVSVSPEYPKSGKEVEIIPQEILDQLHKKIDDLDKKKQEFSFDTENEKIRNLFTVRDSLNGQSKKDKELEINNLYSMVLKQIDDLLKECNAIQDDLKKNLQEFPKTLWLLELQEIVNRHKFILDNQKNTMSVFNDLIATFQLVNQNNNEDTNSENTDAETETGKPSSSIKSFWSKHKLHIIVVVSLLVLVLVGFVVWQDYLQEYEVTAEKEETPIAAPEDNTEMLEKLGNAALEEDKFDKAIEKFKQAGKMDLVVIAKEKAVNYWMEQAFEKAKDKKWQEAIRCLEQTNDYGGYGNIYNDIAEFQKEIENAAEKERKRLAAKPKSIDNKGTTAIDQTTYTNVTIQLSENKRFSIDDTFKATAKSGKNICTGGEWRFEEEIYTEKTENPTIVEIRSLPSDGEALLTYYIDSKLVATAKIKINP